MNPVESESVWDTSVASLAPVSNATVTTPADHDEYRSGQYLDLHLSGESTPAVDPAYSKMEYTLHMKSAATEATHGSGKNTTACRIGLQYGAEKIEDIISGLGNTDYLNRTQVLNQYQHEFTFLSGLKVPNPAGAITLFDEVVTRTDTGVTIEETQRLDLINEMKHLYCKDPIAKFNDSMFSASTVDENEFGLVKPAHRFHYQPSRSSIEDGAIMKSKLGKDSPICSLKIDRENTLQDPWCTYAHFLKFAPKTAAKKIPVLESVNASVSPAGGYNVGNVPANLAKYLHYPGNVFEVWQVEAQSGADPTAAGESGGVAAGGGNRVFIGYCGLASQVASVNSGNSIAFGIILADGVDTTYGPYNAGIDVPIEHTGDGHLDPSKYYALRPVTKISYDIDVPVMHEIPSALFQHPQGNTVYVNHMGGLRMRWRLADPDQWFRHYETHEWGTAHSEISYKLKEVKFRFRTVTPSLDMQEAMNEAMQSADGTSFDIVSYTHAAHTIPQGVNDFTVNLSSFTQRRAFSLLAVPEYNQSMRLHSAKFASILKTPAPTSNTQKQGWRTKTKDANTEKGFKDYQWQLWGRQQPSHAVSVEAVTKCPQGMLNTSGLNAQEQAKALANIGLPVKDLRNQGGMLVIPRRLSSQGGFADLAGEQPANPNLRLRFTDPAPEPFIMHAFCAHQKRISISASAGVNVAE